MEIIDLVEQVNIKFKEGYTSVAKIEKELGYGKDSVRQRLKRNGYTYNKELNQFVLQDNTICYKSDKNEYNPVDQNTGGIKKMTLEAFKKLSTIEKIDYINKFADGKKNLRDIEKEYFTFTNIGKYINRAEAYWDGDKKKYIYIEPREDIFTTEEILFIKSLYKQHKVTQSITQETTVSENIITRSVRVDKDTIETFAKYCKDNNIKQSTALKFALESFMQK